MSSSSGNHWQRWTQLTVTLLVWALAACTAGAPPSAAPGSPPAVSKSAAPAKSGVNGASATPASGILFSEGERLWLIDPSLRAGVSGVQRELLSVKGKGSLTDPVWSPDQTQIAYSFTPATTRSNDFGSDLYLVGADGSNPRVIFTHDVEGGLARAPVWSLDGQALFFSYSFTAPKKDQPVSETVQRVERLEIASGARTVIAVDADLPALSRDGKQLTFIKIPPDSPEPPSLWVADANGANARQLVPGGTFQALWAPRFSLDGQQIIFAAASGTPAQPRLTIKPPRAVGALLPEPPPVAAHGVPMDFWLVDVASGKLELLISLGADDPYVAWSPDGKQLAYLSVEGLYLINLSNAEVTPLSLTPGFGALDWSP